MVHDFTQIYSCARAARAHCAPQASRHVLPAGGRRGGGPPARPGEQPRTGHGGGGGGGRDGDAEVLLGGGEVPGARRAERCVR